MLIEKPVWEPGEAVASAKLNQMVDYAEQSGGTGGIGGAIGSPLTFTLTSSSIAPSASDATKIAKLARVFVPTKVTTSRAAWVRLYADTASRTADLGRGINSDPAEGVLIALEFVTSTGDLVCETPNVTISDSQTTNSGLPATIINLGATTGTVGVTFDYLPLQSYPI